MRSERVSDVRQNLARFIRQVNATRVPILITEYGDPVAILSPLPEDHYESDRKESNDGEGSSPPSV